MGPGPATHLAFDQGYPECLEPRHSAAYWAMLPAWQNFPTLFLLRPAFHWIPSMKPFLISLEFAGNLPRFLPLFVAFSVPSPLCTEEGHDSSQFLILHDTVVPHRHS